MTCVSSSLSVKVANISFRGVIVIPKSSSAARRKQNLDLFSFELEEKESTAIDSLDRGIRFNDPVRKRTYRVYGYSLTMM